MTDLSQTAALDARTRRILEVWRWRVFAATWLCYVGYYFCRKPYSIVKAELGEQLQFSALDLGYIYAAYLLAYTIGQFAAGALGPRFGPRALLLSGMAVTIAASFLFSVVDSVAWFTILMVINGFAQATGWSSCVGTMAAWYHRGERGTIMGLWSTNFQVGGIAANALAAFMLAQAGYQWAFASGAMMLMGVWIFFYFNQANRPEDKGLPAVTDPTEAANAEDDEGEVRWTRSVWTTVLLIGAAYFGMKFIRYAIWSWAPFVLKSNFHLSGEEAGYVSTVFDVCGVVGVIATGWASDRLFGGRRAKISLLMILGCVASTMLLVTLGAADVTTFAICIGLVGFTLFGPDALLTGAGAQDIGSKRGAVRAAGIISGLGSAGSVLQELVIGKMYTSGDGDIGPILATLLGSALLSALCIAAILVRNRRGESAV
jgi:OPA family sugar phosphate sensor protein UhpC-like MFS transporter